MAKLSEIITNRAERTFSQSFVQFGSLISKAQIRPGYYYTFNVTIPNLNENWIPDNKQIWEENPTYFITEKNYYDLTPTGLLLYHENWKEVALIVNLKVMPPILRSKVINAHHFLIEKYIERLEKRDEKGKISLIPFNERESLNAPFYGVTPSLLRTVSNIDVSYAINKYRISDITNARLLDWDKIGELPLAKVESTGLIFSPGTQNLAEVFEIFENNQY